MSNFEFDPWNKDQYDTQAAVPPPYDEELPPDDHDDDRQHDGDDHRGDHQHVDDQVTDDKVKLRADVLRAQLLDHEGLHKIPPPSPLVDGVLDRNTLAWLQGKPGHGKTFVAVDLALCVGAGLLWHERETTPGPVVYVIAEGAAGLAKRVDAWKLANNVTPQNVMFLPVPVQLLKSLDLAALVAVLGDLRPALVIIDTQARVTVGAEENSSRDMGRLVEALEWLRRKSGACIWVVHHEPRSGENLRGHSALEGAATTVMRASKDGSLVTVEILKQKDGPAAPEMRLALTPFGGSCVLSHEAVGIGEFLAGSERDLLGTIWESFGNNKASATTVRAAAGLPDSTFYRALNALVTKGLLLCEQEGRYRYYSVAADNPQGVIPTIPTESQ